ncbi:MAG: biopolymer transporter ExbD [Kiritimatiellae bacterium]|nr:biopolymer transporter ExbD [Kiritimatiellia bacterium]
MRIARSSEDSSDMINMSSLLDVMFILIIFFMATTTFRQEERDLSITLPDVAGGQTLSSAPKVVVINVRKDGTYLFGDTISTLVDVQERVAEALKDDPGQKVLIRGDAKAYHGDVANVAAACRQVGVREAHIGYQTSTTSK